MPDIGTYRETFPALDLTEYTEPRVKAALAAGSQLLETMHSSEGRTPISSALALLLLREHRTHQQVIVGILLEALLTWHALAGEDLRNEAAHRAVDRVRVALHNCNALATGDTVRFPFI